MRMARGGSENILTVIMRLARLYYKLTSSRKTMINTAISEPFTLVELKRTINSLLDNKLLISCPK